MVVDQNVVVWGHSPQSLTRFGFQKHEILNGYVFTVPGLANAAKNSCKYMLYR